QAPSTANAHLVSERLITATFDSYAARHIREGSKAIVTFETSAHEKRPGIVQALHSEAGQTRVMITLKETPMGVQLQVP
ncbi:MAG TPA: hypothetical protein VIS99_16655, partial [Terrimicrobiaceae bacterium]